MTKKSKVASLYFSDGIQPEKIEPLVAQCCSLSSRGVETIHLAINTEGGSVNAGIYAYNMLTGLSCKLVTYNVSVVDSVGVVLFCAGKERYANPSTSFLFHDIRCGNISKLNGDQLEGVATSLRLDEEKVAKIIAGSTSLQFTEIISRFSREAPMSIDDALACKLIDEVKMFVPTTPVMRVPAQS